MTATVTEITRATIASSTFNALSTTVGVVAIILLILLLIQKELMRAYGEPVTRQELQALDIAIVPLLAAFGLIVVMRFVDLLY